MKMQSCHVGWVITSQHATEPILVAPPDAQVFDHQSVHSAIFLLLCHCIKRTLWPKKKENRRRLNALGWDASAKIPANWALPPLGGRGRLLFIVRRQIGATNLSTGVSLQTLKAHSKEIRPNETSSPRPSGGGFPPLPQTNGGRHAFPFFRNFSIGNKRENHELRPRGAVPLKQPREDAWVASSFAHFEVHWNFPFFQQEEKSMEGPRGASR